MNLWESQKLGVGAGSVPCVQEAWLGPAWSFDCMTWGKLFHAGASVSSAGKWEIPTPRGSLAQISI